MTKALMKKQKKELMGRIAGSVTTTARDVFLWRASNETAVINEAINNPDMSMKEVFEKIDRGFLQTCLMMPVSKDPKAMGTGLLVGCGVMSNYLANVGAATGVLSVLMGKLAMAEATLIALPLTVVCFFTKAKLFSDRMEDGTIYRNKIEKKIQEGRRKKMDDVRARMRKMI